MTNFNTNHLSPYAVGFERVLDRLFDHSMTQTPSYPPYNIKKVSDSLFEIEIALAGFSKEDLDIELKNGELVIKGSVQSAEKTEYLHKGISTKKFTRVFTIAEDIEVKGADMCNGLLTITLSRVVPEQEEPTKIKIGSGKKEFLVE